MLCVARRGLCPCNDTCPIKCFHHSQGQRSLDGNTEELQLKRYEKGTKATKSSRVSGHVSLYRCFFFLMRGNGVYQRTGQTVKVSFYTVFFFFFLSEYILVIGLRPLFWTGTVRFVLCKEYILRERCRSLMPTQSLRKPNQVIL